MATSTGGRQHRRGEHRRRQREGGREGGRTARGGKEVGRPSFSLSLSVCLSLSLSLARSLAVGMTHVAPRVSKVGVRAIGQPQVRLGLEQQIDSGGVAVPARVEQRRLSDARRVAPRSGGDLERSGECGIDVRTATQQKLRALEPVARAALHHVRRRTASHVQRRIALGVGRAWSLVVEVGLGSHHQLGAPQLAVLAGDLQRRAARVEAAQVDVGPTLQQGVHCGHVAARASEVQRHDIALVVRTIDARLNDGGGAGKGRGKRGAETRGRGRHLKKQPSKRRGDRAVATLCGQLNAGRACVRHERIAFESPLPARAKGQSPRGPGADS